MIEIQQRFAIDFTYPVLFTRDAFGAGEAALEAVFERAGARRHRVLPVVDAGLLDADPGLRPRLRAFADRNPGLIEWVAPPLSVRGGEACKQDALDVERIHELVERHRICRQSFVLAIGGGAVLDAVGYAAATAHRGVRLLRMPSTVLAQNDAGIGVKNAINAFGRKNFVGTFAPPYAVVNDAALLETLPSRDRRAGIAEAVKVALVKDAGFFEELFAARGALARFEESASQRMIVRCAELHLEHIRTSGDPFELGSARPLDFGHWAAHRLEEISEGDLRHGEAVAIGVALDALYSHAAGMLDELAARRILVLLEELGFQLAHPALRWLDVEDALQAFREHLGGALCITLLEGVGCGTEVHEIDPAAMRACIGALLQRKAGQEATSHAGPMSDVRQGRS
ncbi:MAG: 3-dehydroquinate synthase [Myxococcota bacterium]